MSDYIDILLEDLTLRQGETLPWECRRQSGRALHAAEALMAVLSPEQRKLFAAYEDELGRSSALDAWDLARQAFLLAREIYH